VYGFFFYVQTFVQTNTLQIGFPLVGKNIFRAIT
jgi:hypothetical protein